MYAAGRLRITRTRTRDIDPGAGCHGDHHARSRTLNTGHGNNYNDAG